MTDDKILMSKSWLINGCSINITIPIKLAREYQLDQPSFIIFEGTPEGILIRKAEISTTTKREKERRKKNRS